MTVNYIKILQQQVFSRESPEFLGGLGSRGWDRFGAPGSEGNLQTVGAASIPGAQRWGARARPAPACVSREAGRLPRV